MFDYHVEITSDWPPTQRPKPPYGPGTIEVMRSCPLRSVFEHTPGYERRMGYAARVGTAFHRALQSFNDDPLPAGNLEAAAEIARERFFRELRSQEEEAASRPREQTLPRDASRVSRAAEAIVVEALRIAQQGSSASRHSGVGSHSPARPAERKGWVLGVGSELPPVQVEVPVESKDGLLQGRVDRAERREDGTWLFDYKSAVRDELPERYERQLQLYAVMWYDTYGEWPAQAQVLYPLLGTVHAVSVRPEVCQRVRAESVQVVAKLQQSRLIEELATPGDVCKVCEFRPWCEPFWKWQAGEPQVTKALANAVMGFEGHIRSMTLESYRWRLRLGWRNAEVQMQAPQERFPQLARAQVGTRVRVLDTALRGLRYEPTAAITEQSELFLVH